MARILSHFERKNFLSIPNDWTALCGLQLSVANQEISSQMPKISSFFPNFLPDICWVCQLCGYGSTPVLYNTIVGQHAYKYEFLSDKRSPHQFYIIPLLDSMHIHYTFLSDKQSPHQFYIIPLLDSMHIHYTFLSDKQSPHQFYIIPLLDSMHINTHSYQINNLHTSFI